MAWTPHNGFAAKRYRQLTAPDTRRRLFDRGRQCASRARVARVGAGKTSAREDTHPRGCQSCDQRRRTSGVGSGAHPAFRQLGRSRKCHCRHRLRPRRPAAPPACLGQVKGVVRRRAVGDQAALGPSIRVAPMLDRRASRSGWLPSFGTNRKRCFLALAIFLMIGAPDLQAQGRVKVLFPYSVVNYSSLPWMIAKDTGLFRKSELDVDLVFMGSSSLIIQSMLSGSVPVAGVAGPAVISSVVSGGDVVTVANLAPLTIALMVKPAIEKPEDLRGKKIGVPRFAIRLILDRHGIKDATILQMGSQPEAAAGMRRDAIDGAMISLPLNYVLAKEGFRELVGPQDYRKLGIQFISQGISARRSFGAKNRDVVMRLMKGTMEGL